MASEVSNSVPSLLTQRRARVLVGLLSAFSILGLVLSVFLTEHFYEIRNGTAGFKSFCNISATSNCDVVAASPYAELFLGLPISSFSAGWFLALFFTALFAWNPFWRREALRAGLAMTVVGTGLSLAYLGIMVGILNTYCLLCLGVDGFVVASLVLILLLKPEGFSKHRPDLKKMKWLAIVCLLSLIVMVGGLKTRDENRISDTEANALASQILESRPLSLSSNETIPSIGPKSAKVTITEFSDFQCPFCRIGALLLNSVLNRYPNQIRVEFRNFPLDQKCHPELSYTPHPVACEAAKASICAHKQGQFEGVYQKLFENQTTLAPGRALEYAQALGLNAATFESCLNSPETAAAISADIREANLLSIQSTPTFFLNGHKMEGPMPLPVWFAVIDRLLKN